MDVLLQKKEDKMDVLDQRNTQITLYVTFRQKIIN